MKALIFSLVFLIPVCGFTTEAYGAIYDYKIRIVDDKGNALMHHTVEIGMGRSIETQVTDAYGIVVIRVGKFHGCPSGKSRLARLFMTGKWSPGTVKLKIDGHTGVIRRNWKRLFRTEDVIEETYNYKLGEIVD